MIGYIEPLWASSILYLHPLDVGENDESWSFFIQYQRREAFVFLVIYYFIDTKKKIILPCAKENDMKTWGKEKYLECIANTLTWLSNDSLG